MHLVSKHSALSIVYFVVGCACGILQRNIYFFASSVMYISILIMSIVREQSQHSTLKSPL